MKKEIKKTKLKPRKKAEVKRDQYTVVLEDVRRQFGVITEGFSGMHRRFDKLDKKVDNNRKEFLEFRNEMTGLKRETNSNFKTSFEYLSKIDDELQLMKVEIADLKVIFKDRVELKRVIKMERQMVIMQGQINTLMAQR